MSHATYCFLINISDPEATDQEIASDVVDTIAMWAERHCDENNWYQEEAVVLANPDPARAGRVVGFAPVPGYRNEMGARISLIPQQDRWEWARLLSLQCVASNFELGGRSSYSFLDDKPEESFWNNFDDLKKQILDEMPPRLAALWARGALENDDNNRQNFLDAHHRNKWSREMGLFLGSIRWGTVPFATDGTPYDYRAFDLTNGHEGTAIVFVDIHT
jgi:hypothetical protein